VHDFLFIKLDPIEQNSEASAGDRRGWEWVSVNAKWLLEKPTAHWWSAQRAVTVGSCNSSGSLRLKS